jgi:excinuclease ABC subunit C
MTQSGALLIKSYVKTLSGDAGVYRMLSADGKVLYVGKAKNLKNRVVAYTRVDALPIRLQRMIFLTHAMEFVVTKTEWEALILEATLIKKFQPPYNVLLKDDKAYPYLVLTKGDLPPRLMIYRGSAQKNGDYFGPFGSMAAVQQTFELLVRTFNLRTCADTVYRNRKRPCLQYYIHRCSGPCVGKITPTDYDQSLYQVKQFLQGKTHDIQKTLKDKMLEASGRKEFERAALLRDQLQALTRIQEEQGVRLERLAETDVIAIFKEQGVTAIQVFFFRHGWNYGNHSFFPSHDPDDSTDKILETFLAQFYLNKPLPKEILTNHPLSSLLKEALQGQSKKAISFHVPKQGDKKQLVEMATHNAKEALARRLAHASSQKALLEKVQALFDLPTLPERIEVYDNSHTQGAVPYGGMIVATPDGFDKRAYRTFSIKGTKEGDDYAMMTEVLTRRFLNKGLPTPDLVLIDGGKGHLSTAMAVFKDLNLSMPLVAISKGVDRNAGREVFHQPGKDPFQLPPTDQTLYYLQRLRDEAHRFAIGTHRRGRTRSGIKSMLNDIEGIGPKRRKRIIDHFENMEALKTATVEELQEIPGINQKVAEAVYRFFSGR